VIHGDATPLVADGIVPASFLSRGARILKKKNCSFLFFGVSCHDAVVWILFLTGASPPAFVTPPRQLTCHRVLHRLCDQAIILDRLIVALVPDFRVTYTPIAHHKSSTVLPFPSLGFN
jgi:hypothetical protein